MKPYSKTSKTMPISLFCINIFCLPKLQKSDAVVDRKACLDSTKEESTWTDNVNKNRLNRDAVIVLSSVLPSFH